MRPARPSAWVLCAPALGAHVGRERKLEIAKKIYDIVLAAQLTAEDGLAVPLQDVQRPAHHVILPRKAGELRDPVGGGMTRRHGVQDGLGLVAVGAAAGMAAACSGDTFGGRWT